MQAAILTDTTKCIGCRECVLACKKENSLAPDVPHRWNLDDGLSARNWTSIIDRPDGRYVRKQCRHCIEPACVSSCPVGAIRKTEAGPVIYDGDKCMGCRYCMMACPYGIPRYDWDQAVPYIRKCVLCYETRVKNGKQPACTEACPTEATIFGERSDLIQLAHQRIRSEPEKYIDKVWGEHEVGGTSVLYIADTDLSFLAPGELDDQPMPERTKLAMNAVPFTFVGVAAAMAGVNWVIGRRMKLQSEPETVEPAKTAAKEDGDV
jgi:formate dehydrogenase iron-sulfur subunit